MLAIITECAAYLDEGLVVTMLLAIVVEASWQWCLKEEEGKEILNCVTTSP